LIFHEIENKLKIARLVGRHVFVPMNGYATILFAEVVRQMAIRSCTKQVALTIRANGGLAQTRLNVFLCENLLCASNWL